MRIKARAIVRILVSYGLLQVVMPLLGIGLGLLFIYLAADPPDDAVKKLICNGTLVFYAGISAATNLVKTHRLKDLGLLQDTHLLVVIPLVMIVLCAGVYGLIVIQAIMQGAAAAGISGAFDQARSLRFTILMFSISVIYGLTIEVLGERSATP
jgi:hypothetical protein